MNIWEIAIWAILSFCFVSCLCIIINANNWVFVIGLLVSALTAYYFLGQA